MNRSKEHHHLHQLPLDFYYRPYMGRDDFMPSSCNFAAFRLIDSWPMWTYFAACIYGPEGCGKTHLANIFSEKVSAVEHYPYKIPCIEAKNLTLDMPRQLLSNYYFLIVENLTTDINQEALFNLYNIYRDEGGSILFTSRQAPARLNFALADLRSRMNIVPSIEIKEPDDDLLSALLVKLFMDRQINITPEIINYILANMQRSFAYAKKLVAEIDTISLAQKRAVSIPIVKEALENLSDNKQGELFSLNNGQGELF